MKIHLILLSLLCLWSMVQGSDGITIEVQNTLSPNLLTNSGFEKTAPDQLPEGWGFANMADSKNISAKSVSEGAIGKKAVRIDSIGNLPGYLYFLKPVPVQENTTYFAKVKFKAEGPRGLLWLRTDQWQDGKNALFPPWSQTEIFSYGDGSQSDEARETLALFIDRELLRGIVADEWTEFSAEFTVPSGKGIKDYIVRAGTYYGNGGYLLIDDIYFGLAARTTNIKITGSNLVAASIINPDGAVVYKTKLNPKQTQQQISCRLPSVKTIYRLKLEDQNGSIHWKEF